MLAYIGLPMSDAPAQEPAHGSNQESEIAPEENASDVVSPSDRMEVPKTKPQIAEFDTLRFVSQHIVKDPLTSIALGGVDPLSYFIDGEPRLGAPEHEAIFGGAIWWFDNIGNRDAFLDAPEVYIPAFGGHGVLSMSRGFLAEGRPQFWLIHKGKILLFYSAVNRVAFMQNSEGIFGRALEQWTELSKNLVR